MKTLYNEGRVVGTNPYEMYVRQLMAQDSSAVPMSERQWIASNLSCNSSMILKIPAGTPAGVHNYILPANSQLCGASIIYASMFEGTVTLNQTGEWAANVNDYGRLVSNTPELHPVSPGEPSDIPTKDDPITITNDLAEQCRNYLKITSALMFQPGEWTSIIEYTDWLTEEDQQLVTEYGENITVPTKISEIAVGIDPDFSKQGFIRLAIQSQISSDIYVLFNGFTYNTFVNGSIGFQEVIGFSNPENGDFLGPQLFPWACKIVLVTTNEVMNVVISDIEQKIAQLHA